MSGNKTDAIVRMIHRLGLFFKLIGLQKKRHTKIG